MTTKRVYKIMFIKKQDVFNHFQQQATEGTQENNLVTKA